MLNGKNIKLAIQKKGRLTRTSVGLLRSCGFDFRVDERQLFSPCDNFPLEVLYLRDDDIPDIVQTGATDLGIVHEILLHEKRLKLKRLLQLGFGSCSLAVAVPNQTKIRSLADLKGLRVATSYPNSTKRFFDERQIPVEIIKMNGSIELMPWLKIADAIVDLTSTGSTLYWHELRVVENIYCDLDTFLVANYDSMVNKGKIALINDILARFQEVIKYQALKSKRV